MQLIFKVLQIFSKLAISPHYFCYCLLLLDDNLLKGLYLSLVLLGSFGNLFFLHALFALLWSYWFRRWGLLSIFHMFIRPILFTLLLEAWLMLAILPENYRSDRCLRSLGRPMLFLLLLHLLFLLFSFLYSFLLLKFELFLFPLSLFFEFVGILTILLLKFKQQLLCLSIQIEYLTFENCDSVEVTTYFSFLATFEGLLVELQLLYLCL